VERIGHYKIVSELGRGGMGVVYKAHEESLNRYVAIKVLGEHLEEDAEYVERFVREAQSAAGLSHPNIVQIYAISEEDGHHYFVMEYVPGTSVQRMIQTKGKLPPANAARLILQAAAGLQDAHSQGVIHRDIKPANLMVTDRGLVKIADFGLALMGAATTRLTATGMLMGTPGYLSPEQCLDQSPDHRTDLYSLGVTFFEMVTGTMPFRADSPLALLKLIVEVDPPDVRELNPEVDEDLREIIGKMLAKDRDQRHSSATEVIADIQQWLESKGEPMQDLAAGVGTGSAAGVLPPPPPAASAEDLNTEPTVAVPSGASGPPPSAPPPPVPAASATEPAAAATAPAPQATAPTTQPPATTGRSHTGLIAAAVVIFIVALGAVAAVLTVKSGILGALFKNEQAKLAELEADTVPTRTDDDSATQDKIEPVESGAEAGLPPTIDDRVPEPLTAVSSPPPSDAADDLIVADDTADVTASPGETKTTTAAGAAAMGEPQPAAQPPAPMIRAAPPTGTVVLAVGEQLLAVEAETYVKARLERAGVEIVEITSIPGLEGLVNTEARPAPEQVRAAIRPHARYLVPIRVEYLGDRAVVYMGQRDVVFQARVNMGLVDLASGRALGRPANIKLEYTQLNADEVVERELRRATTNLVQQLPRD
jgi:serine/threonine-protein kinase